MRFQFFPRRIPFSFLFLMMMGFFTCNFLCFSKIPLQVMVVRRIAGRAGKEKRKIEIIIYFLFILHLIFFLYFTFKLLFPPFYIYTQT